MNVDLLNQIKNTFPKELIVKGKKIHAWNIIGAICYFVFATILDLYIIKNSYPHIVYAATLINLDTILMAILYFTLAFVAFVCIYLLIRKYIVFIDGENDTEDEYRQYIYNILVKSIWPNSNYDVDGGIDAKSYIDKMFNQHYNVYEESSLVMINANSSFSFVKLLELQYNGNRSYKLVPVFMGLVGKMKLQKHTNVELKILSNSLKNKNNSITMDSSEFEDYFDVVSSDNVIAMQILTPDTMSKIIEIHKKYKNIFEIVVEDDTIFFRIKVDDTLFYTSIGDPFNEEKIALTYNCFYCIKELTEYINEMINSSDL